MSVLDRRMALRLLSEEKKDLALRRRRLEEALEVVENSCRKALWADQDTFGCSCPALTSRLEEEGFEALRTTYALAAECEEALWQEEQRIESREVAEQIALESDLRNANLSAMREEAQVED